MQRDARSGRPIDDPEPTLRMPAPGGQPSAVLQRPPVTSAAAHAGLELQRLVAGINPLLGAAATLLALAEQLRHTASHDDPPLLRRQLLQQVADFEAAAAAAGVPRPKVTAARYLLCTFLDEVIGTTPWGAANRAPTLLQEFHDETSGADKAFQLLERLGQEPADNTELLELFYVCLRLGFEGRYRGARDGAAQLEAITAKVFEVLQPAAAQPGGSARRLSAPAQGVVRQREQPAAVVPLWMLALLASGALLGWLLWLGTRLDTMAQPVFRSLLAVPQALRIERTDAGAAPARVAPGLKAEIAQGALAVRDETLRSVLTLPADTLFVPGSDRVDDRRAALLQRIGAVLKQQPGQIAVIGHTDDSPAPSLQFPSSWHLSHAWARAVMAELVRAGVPPARLRAEGRADAQPLSPESDAAARTRNRRVEIEVQLPRPEAAPSAS
jgi:type VI secretion system protein ImpK